MKGIRNLIVLILLATVLLTCKKKTTIKVTLFNYALGEPITNATIALVERKQGGLFQNDGSCHAIAHATTDANGVCHFDNEKLRNRGVYAYFFGITNAYGIPLDYPCSGTTKGFIEKGKTQDMELNLNEFKASFRVQYNNLLTPSQPGDSLVVTITSPKYQTPGTAFSQGGGGVFYSFPSYADNGYPYNNSILTSIVNTISGKNVIHIRKTKLGVVTFSHDTLKLYPNETKTVTINW